MSDPTTGPTPPNPGPTPERRTTVTPGRRRHRTRRPGRTALTVVAAVVVLVVGGLGTASVLTGRAADSAVSELASALATGLQTGDLDSVPMFPADGEPEPTPQAELAAITAGMEGTVPDVTVSGIDLQSARDREATATLTWAWELGETGQTWEYATRVLLREDPTGTSESGWAAVWTPTLVEPSLEESEVLVAQTVEPGLGTVQRADGSVMVGEVPATVIGLETEGLAGDELDESAVAITRALGLDVENYRDRLEDAPPGSFVPAMTIRDPELDRFDTEGALAVAGASQRQTTLLLELDRYDAPGVAGQTRWASAADAVELGGDVAEGDMIAETGVVAGMLDQLVGTPGFRVVAGAPEAVANPDAPLPAELPEGARAVVDVPVVHGVDVVTSLDGRLQDLAQSAVADTESPSALVAMRPSTGEILAVGTGPELSTFPRGLVGQYAPGSTFKVVSALGMLRSGFTPETALDCPETHTVEGFTFRNAESFDPARLGTMTLTQALAHSCNTAFAAAASDVSPAVLTESAQALGIEQGNNTGHPGIYLGGLPSDESPLSHAGDMIGQGTVLASPVAMANVAASVQQGAAVQVRLVTSPAPGGDRAPAAPVTAAEAEQLRAMMRAVVTDGTLESLADVPGEPVHGKTGTAEADVGGQRVLNAWTMVFQGDLAVAVLVEDGGYGSETAAPIVEDFLRRAAP